MLQLYGGGLTFRLPYGDAGEQEQLGRLASGLTRQRGRRLVVARAAVVVLLLAIAAVVLASLIHLVG